MSTEIVAVALSFATLFVTLISGLVFLGYRTGIVVRTIENFRQELLKCQGNSRAAHDLIDRHLEKHGTLLVEHGERLVSLETQARFGESN